MRQQKYMIKGCYLVLFFFGLLVSKSAFAIHLDVGVWMDNNKLHGGFCPDASLGCDSLSALSRLGLSADQLPVDGSNGREIFLSDFGDLAGGTDSTDDPGFQGLAGWLPSNTLLKYRAVDALQTWRADSQSWHVSPSGGPQIRLFGGLSTETVLSTDTSHCNGLLICIPKEISETVYNEGSTVFTGQGISAAASLIIDNTSADGALHAHLDWYLENIGDVGDAAYLLALQLISDGYQDSDPFYILFNHGLSEENLAKAVQMRMTPDALATVPVPAALPLFMMAIAGVGFFQRRNKD